MGTSPAKAEIRKILVEKERKEEMKEIQEKLSYIQTKLVAPKGQFNSFGNYKYRSCEDILEALKPLLKETTSTLIITDEIVQFGDRYYVKAMATLHYLGENVSVSAFAREPDNKKGMDEAQITGATSSYARKYALNGLFCIDDTKDADATNKHDRNGAKTPRQSTDELKELAMEMFKDPDEFKAWRIENNLIEDLKGADSSARNNVINELKKRRLNESQN